MCNKICQKENHWEWEHLCTLLRYNTIGDPKNNQSENSKTVISGPDSIKCLALILKTSRENTLSLENFRALFSKNLGAICMANADEECHLVKTERFYWKTDNKNREKIHHKSSNQFIFFLPFIKDTTTNISRRTLTFQKNLFYLRQ